MLVVFLLLLDAPLGPWLRRTAAAASLGVGAADCAL